jgi:uncharacterized membrane protein
VLLREGWITRIKDLLKYTYLLDVKKIDDELSELWNRYEEILENPNWEDMNEAWAILYMVGYIYTEDIAPQAIEKRLHVLKKPMSLLSFFTLVDSKSDKLKEYRKDLIFKNLEDYYRVIKKNKNRLVDGKLYMNEEKFIKLYNKYNPNKKSKIKEKGKF